MDAVSILTPTGDRETSLRLLCRYIRRQTFPGAIQWVLVDDGEIPWRPDANLARPPAAAAFDLTYIRRHEPDVKGGSLQRNLIHALQAARYDKLVVMEDDDWYRADYVGALAGWLDTFALVGEGESTYYHVGRRRFRPIGNRAHASLCSTGFRREILVQVERCCRQSSAFVDLAIWKLDVPRVVHRSEGLVVGIKGMPGRTGIGSGHKAGGGYREDGSGAHLRRLLGHDATLYGEFYATPIPTWWDWVSRRNVAAARWCVVGKGPSFAAAESVGLHQRCVLGLNHVCRERPVEVTHLIDVDVVHELGPALEQRSEVVVIPWHPHVDSKPTEKTLPEFVREIPLLETLRGQGRLLTYHAGIHERFRTRPVDQPCVGVRYFSVEAACNLLLAAGVREIATLGVDGGADYAPQFSDLPVLRNGRVSFDCQFGELQRVADKHRARITALADRSGRLYCDPGQGPPLAFVHVPKAAGMAVRQALEGLPEFETRRHRLYGEESDTLCAWPRLVCGHVPASEMAARYPGARLIAVLRDPVDRLVSHWRFWTARLQSIDLTREPLTDPHLVRFARERPTIEEFAAWYPATLRALLDVPVERWSTGALLRYERLDEDWPRLLQALGLPPRPLPHVNATPPATEQPEFDPAALERLLADDYRWYDELLSACDPDSLAALQAAA